MAEARSDSGAEQDFTPQHPESLAAETRLQEAIKAVPEFENLSDDALVELGEVLAGAHYDLEQALGKLEGELEWRGLRQSEDEEPDS